MSQGNKMVMSVDERIAMLKVEKEFGDRCFGKGDYEGAEIRYKKGYVLFI